MKKTIFGNISISIAVVVVALILFGATAGWAEQRRVSYKWPAANANYTKQYTIDVDTSHQLRIFELRFSFPENPPMFDGVKVKEEWLRGSSDYVNLNGRVSGHGEFIMENGDKIYYWADGVSQTIMNPDGTKKSTSTMTKHVGGGTGKFISISGVLRHKAIFDPKTGFNEGENEGEYWMAR